MEVHLQMFQIMLHIRSQKLLNAKIVTKLAI